jgi:opacity protein-like surface antigen
MKIAVAATAGVIGISPALAKANDGSGWLLGLGIQQTQTHVVTTSPLGDYDSKDNAARAYIDGRYRFVLKEPFDVQLSMAISPGTSPAGGFLASGNYSIKDTISMSLAPGIRLNERTLVLGVLSAERLTLQFSQRNIARSSSIDGIGVGIGIQYTIEPNLIAEILYKDVRLDSARIPFDSDLKTRNVAFALHRRF